MSFFERPEPEDDWDDEEEVWDPADSVVGAAVPIAPIVVARTTDAAVAVTNLLADPAGVSFTIVACDRRGRMRPDLMHEHFGPRSGALPDDLLRFGVELANGAKATTIDPWRFGDDADVERPALDSGSGGGSDHRYDSGYRLRPLPPPGPMWFVCEWPAVGIGESRVEVDASAIRSAAERAMRLWPEEI